jgi:hypothetical protein
MKHKKTITTVAFLLLGLGGLHAQESRSATGGEASGTGGTTSYTVGQMFYTTQTGTNESVAQGVQQPFEISTTVGINETTINLELSVYPNPTTNVLNLKVENVDGLIYQLFDKQGKLLENKTVVNTNTTINVENLPSSTYFLKVTKNSQVTKTFKIIKN